MTPENAFHANTVNTPNINAGMFLVVGRISFQLGSDGESEEASGNSEDKELSPVKLRSRHRRFSEMASFLSRLAQFCNV